MTVFLAFGDPRYEQSLRRIEGEAAASGFFDRLAIKRPGDLGKAFWRKHGKFVGANRRGYGYWLWKPWLILQELQSVEPGEVLVYVDAGCTINAKARERFDHYVWMARESPSGITGFRLPHPEKSYTKGDVFEALQGWGLKDTPQILAGMIVMQSRRQSIELARRWLALAENYDLLSNRPSRVPNDPTFIAHKNDMSLFSLLVKLNGGAALIDDETLFDDWNDASAFPFWATRHKGARSGPLRGIRRRLGVGWQRLRA